MTAAAATTTTTYLQSDDGSDWSRFHQTTSACAFPHFCDDALSLVVPLHSYTEDTSAVCFATEDELAVRDFLALSRWSLLLLQVSYAILLTLSCHFLTALPNCYLVLEIVLHLLLQRSLRCC